MAETQVFGGAAQPVDHRSKRSAVKRGFLGKCPNCGEGRLFSGYVSVRDECDICHEELHHHRADDFPAYLVIFIIGHTLVPGFLAAYFWLDMGPWAQLALWVPFTVAATLLLLPRVKGAVIGLQWALRMHGFGGHEDETYEI